METPEIKQGDAPEKSFVRQNWGRFLREVGLRVQLGLREWKANMWSDTSGEGLCEVVGGAEGNNGKR